MRYEVRSIGIWSYVRVHFFINMILGFVGGLLYSLFLVTFSRILSESPFFRSEGIDLSDAPVGIMLVVLPFVFAIIGAFVYTFIGVVLILLYNGISRLVGGMELRLEMVPVAAPPATMVSRPLAGSPTAPPPPPPPTSQSELTERSSQTPPPPESEADSAPPEYPGDEQKDQ